MGVFSGRMLLTFSLIIPAVCPDSPSVAFRQTAAPERAVAVWGCLGVSGDVWGCLGMSGGVWGCLGVSGDVWGVSGDVWGCLGMSFGF